MTAKAFDDGRADAVTAAMALTYVSKADDANKTAALGEILKLEVESGVARTTTG
jgi:hypothetical protein